MFIRSRTNLCSHKRWDNKDDLIYCPFIKQKVKERGRFSFHWRKNSSGLRCSVDNEGQIFFLDIQEFYSGYCFADKPIYSGAGECSASFMGAVRSQQFTKMQKADYVNRIGEDTLQDYFEFPKSETREVACPVLLKTLIGKR